MVILDLVVTFDLVVILNLVVILDFVAVLDFWSTNLTCLVELYSNSKDILVQNMLLLR